MESTRHPESGHVANRPPRLDRDLVRRLLALEVETNLFAVTVAGTRFWEFVRLPVFYALANALDVLSFPPLRPPRRSALRAARTGLSLLAGAAWQNPFRVGRRPLLVFGYPRRTHVGGRWEDVHFDPLLADLPCEYLYLEPSHEDGHRARVPTRSRRFHDAIDLAAGMDRLRRPFQLDDADRATLRRITGDLRETFGVEIDLSGITRTILARRRSLRPWYRRLLDRVQPNLVLLASPNHREFTLIEVARELGIATAEMQHGVIGEHDPSYTFPRGTAGPRQFADHLLVFGDYWRELLGQLPEGTEVRSVGFAHLERQLARHNGHGENLTFLSQQTIGEPLSRFAVELSRRPGFDVPIVYRLHPDETNWRDRYPWLANTAVRIETCEDRSVYESFAHSRAQIGVYSLAVYEGLACGLRTILVDLPGVEQLQRLVDRGIASLVSRPDEVPALLGDSCRIDVEPFARPRAVENVAAFVREHVEGVPSRAGAFGTSPHGLRNSA